MIGNRSEEHERDQRERSDATNTPAGKQSPMSDEAFLEDPGEPRCAECGGLISQSDIVCPHCGTSLAAG